MVGITVYQHHVALRIVYELCSVRWGRIIIKSQHTVFLFLLRKLPFCCVCIYYVVYKFLQLIINWIVERWKWCNKLLPFVASLLLPTSAVVDSYKGDGVDVYNVTIKIIWYVADAVFVGSEMNNVYCPMGIIRTIVSPVTTTFVEWIQPTQLNTYATFATAFPGIFTR